MECELAKRQAPGGHVVCAGRWKRNRQKLGHAAAHTATSGQAHNARHGPKQTSIFFCERIQTSTAGPSESSTLQPWLRSNSWWVSAAEPRPPSQIVVLRIQTGEQNQIDCRGKSVLSLLLNGQISSIVIRDINIKVDTCQIRQKF